MWIIVDIDGTIALTGPRVVFAREKRWDEFHDRMGEDTVNAPVLAVLNALTLDHPIACLTGRPERYRGLTRTWLLKHRVPFSSLLMRPNNDWRPDTELKIELARGAALEPRNVLFVLEDRDRTVEMWRGWGYTCFQVAKGEY